jgi:hypothetical protein
MTRFRLVPMLLVLHITAVPAAWCTPPVPTDPLDAVRKAVDMPGRTAAPLWFRGRLVNGDLVQPWTLCVDGLGRFAERTSGPLGEAFGFDGHQGWVVDFTGMPRSAGPGELEEERFAAWVLGSYWLAESCPLRAEPAGEDSLGSVLELSDPGSRFRGRLTVDPNSHLPVLLDRGTVDGWETMRLEAYRLDGGAIRPHRLILTQPPLVTEVLIDSVRTGVPADTAAFLRPTEEPADFAFDPAAPNEVAVRHLPGQRHLLVRPKINGAEVGWFVVDSGASTMCLAKNVADSLGLPVLGDAVANGWNGTAKTAFRQGRTFELGPIRIDNTRYLETPASFGLDSAKVRIAGIVGYDLFRRAVVDLDVKTPRMRILPADLDTPASAWQPLRLDAGLPAVRCTVAGGREEWFAIDTGAAFTVIFLPRLAQELGLTPRDPKDQSPFRQVDLRDFQVAGRTYPRWYAFVLSGRGFPEDRWLGGALGRWLLWDYRLVFDYRHERVAMIRQSSQKRAGRG